MNRATRPSELLREQLKRRVAEDGRGYDTIAELVGIKGPSLHRFLNTPGSGSDALPKLMKLFGFSDLDATGLDDEQIELLRAFEAAREAGRDGAALVSAFKTITGVEPAAKKNAPTPMPPKSRGSNKS
jgi:hypothetical protein